MRAKEWHLEDVKKNAFHLIEYVRITIMKLNQSRLGPEYYCDRAMCHTYITGATEFSKLDGFLNDDSRKHRLQVSCENIIGDTACE